MAEIPEARAGRDRHDGADAAPAEHSPRALAEHGADGPYDATTRLGSYANTGYQAANSIFAFANGSPEPMSRNDIERQIRAVIVGVAIEKDTERVSGR